MSLESDLAFIEEHRASLDGAQEERLYKDGVRMRNFVTGKGFGWRAVEQDGALKIARHYSGGFRDLDEIEGRLDDFESSGVTFDDAGCVHFAAFHALTEEADRARIRHRHDAFGKQHIETV